MSDETARERAIRALGVYGTLLKPTGQTTGGKKLHATTTCMHLSETEHVRPVAHPGELPLTVGGLCSACVHLEAAEAGEIDVDPEQRAMTDGGTPGSHLAAADDELVEAQHASRDGDGSRAREAIRRARQRIQAAMTSDGGEA